MFWKIVLPRNSEENSAEKMYVKSTSGANPTIVSYNASVVKIYSNTGILVCFESKDFFFQFEKEF
jgi:hypothetical protein